jgi:glycosyltransferase involved in cell wall biosynthesis
MPLTVLINAGPWLPVPPPGYGGIENVLASLIPELRRRGVRVVLCTVGGSTAEAKGRYQSFPEGQFGRLAAPYGQVMGITHAHMATVLRALRERPGVDLVHDHLEVVGPSVLAARGGDGPPVLQTLHWDLGKHPEFYRSFDGGGRVFFNGVSHAQLRAAPPQLRAQSLGAVHLGVDLAAHRPRADRARTSWWAVRPFEDGERIRWGGTVGGAAKAALVGRARAVLMPISWEEPGATAAVEALACGTPVIAMRRGALAEIVEHGVTGFLADDEAELAGYLPRAGEIDPAACRRAAGRRFSAAAMADAYLRLYHQVLARTR